MFLFSIIHELCVNEFSWEEGIVSLSKQHEILACEYLHVPLALKFQMYNAYINRLLFWFF